MTATNKAPTQLPKMERTARISIDIAALKTRAEGDDDRIPVALSSEEPVRRWWGTEILDHTPEAVDLSRAERGLPLVDNHNSWDSVARQFGVIEDVALGPDRVLRGLMRFSKRTIPQAIRQDVLDGIITNMSIGYRIIELTLVKSGDDGDVYRATKWELLEGSLVCVPADATVGVGRAAEQEKEMPVNLVRGEEPAPGPAPVEAPAADEPDAEVERERLSLELDIIAAEA